MKKIIVMLLTLALLVGFAACNKPSDNGEGSSSPESSESKPESSESKPDRTELPYTVPMSDTVKYAIETDWYDQTGEIVTWFDKDAEKLDYEAIRYYGYFSGYLVLFKHVGWDLEYECALEVAGQRFVHDEMFEIYAYKDGSFLELQSAYESEKLTFPDVAIIAEIHGEFEEYIKMYSAD